MTIYGMPEFLKKQFGCYQAIGLDSGGSLGLSYEGKSYAKPGRKIMDAFVVVPAKKRPVANETKPTVTIAGTSSPTNPTNPSSVASNPASVARSKASELKARIDRALERKEPVQKWKYWFAIERKLREFLEEDIPQSKKDVYAALIEMIPQ